MTLGEFIDSKKTEEFGEFYINFYVLNDALDNVCRLEREKRYNLDFTIIHPHETSDRKYHVLPVITNEEIMYSYQAFLNLLKCELSRVDNAINSYINNIELELRDTKLELVKFSFENKTWSGFLPIFLNFQQYRKNAATRKLSRLEGLLKVFRKSVISVNKFILSKVLEYKQHILSKSHYSHLLFQVEIGREVPARPSPFPIKGKQNCHLFASLPSPPLISITAASPDSGRTLTPPVCLEFSHPPQNNFLTLPKTYNPLPTKFESMKSIDSFNSSTPELNSLSSSASSIASTNSSFSPSEVIRSVCFWTSSPSSLKTMIDEVKALKKTQAANKLKLRLMNEMP